MELVSCDTKAEIQRYSKQIWRLRFLIDKLRLGFFADSLIVFACPCILKSRRLGSSVIVSCI